MLKQAIYFGLGAISLTRDKAEQVIKDMVEKGELSRDEAKNFVDTAVKRGEEEKKVVQNMIKQEIQGYHEKVTQASREEMDELKKRIQDLEDRVTG